MANKKRKLLEHFMKDFWWKILSLLIAVSLWFVVINLENPVESRALSLPLEVRNTTAITDKGQVISNLAELNGAKVSVKIRGQRLSLDRLVQNKAQIQAYIDLSSFAETSAVEEEVTMAVNVKLPQNIGGTYEMESKTPTFVTIKVENKIGKEFPIEFVIDGGNATTIASYRPELSVNSVQISGTESVVNKIDKVKASLRVEDIKEDNSYVLDIIPYDSTGLQVTGVEMDTQSVEVYIPIKASKKVALVPSMVGTVAEGFSFVGATCEPEFIYLLGDEAAIAGIEELQLPSVNLSEKNTNFDFGFVTQYVIPSGLKLKPGEPTKITVKVIIEEEIRKEVTLKSGNISFKSELPEGLVADIVPEDITLEIKGNEAIIGTIIDEDISGSLTIAETLAGEYRLPIVVTLPDGVTLTQAESPYVTVIIRDFIVEGEETD